MDVVGDRLDSVREPDRIGDELAVRVALFGSAQQSSRLTYWYPAAFRPLATKMSAMPSTIVSLNSARQWVEFQLLKPIGGVRARPLPSRAAAAGGFCAAAPE